MRLPAFYKVDPIKDILKNDTCLKIEVGGGNIMTWLLNRPIAQSGTNIANKYYKNIKKYNTNNYYIYMLTN